MTLRDAHAGNVRSLSVVGAAASSRKAARKQKAPTKPDRSPLKALSDVTLRSAARLRKWAIRAKIYGLPADLKVVEALNQAVSALGDAAIGLSRVPADWKPARGSGSMMAVLDEGAIVRIKQEHRALRIELRDASTKLAVVRAVGGKVVCKVNGGKDEGLLIVVPRVHLEKVDEK